MTSLATMIRQIEGLHDTEDVNEWENDFISNIVKKTRGGQYTLLLTSAQIENVEKIWSKHFA